MSDAPSTDGVATPYGPAPTDAADSLVAPPMTASQAPSMAVLDGARRALRVAAIASGVLAVVLMITLVVWAALGGGPANNDLDGVEETVTWALVWGSPVLAVVAVNLLVWRALLRPLARMSTGKSIALAITMVIVLALFSVLAVTVLLFLGFLAGVLFSAGSGFGA